MATASDMRQLVERVLTQFELLRQFENEIRDGLQQASARFDALKAILPRDVLGTRTEDWADLDANDRTEQHERLLSLDETLKALSERARSPSANETRVLLAYAIGLPLLLLIPTFLGASNGALPIVTEASEPLDQTSSDPSAANSGVHLGWVYVMIMCLRALGGCLRLISSLVLYLGKRMIYRSWLPFYYFAPLEGGILAIIICLLVVGGIVELQTDQQLEAIEDVARANRTTLLYLYALAGFSGLFAKNVLRKLRDVADALFTKPSSSDSA